MNMKLYHLNWRLDEEEGDIYRIIAKDMTMLAETIAHDINDYLPDCMTPEEYLEELDLTITHEEPVIVESFDQLTLWDEEGIKRYESAGFMDDNNNKGDIKAA